MLPKATPGFLLHYCRSQRGKVNILSAAQRRSCSDILVQGQRRERSQSSYLQKHQCNRKESHASITQVNYV